jgi:hypothetical protein
MYEVIINLILDAGAERESQSSLISGCNRESLIALLPNILLIFPQSGARIVLYPDDFIRFNIERNECSLDSGSTGSSLGMNLNPLLIPGINFHITQTELLICDDSS